MSCQADEDEGLEPQTRGDDWLFNCEFTKADGTPEDITGAVIWITLKDSKADADAAAKLQHSATVPSGADATNGIFTLLVPNAKTKLVPDATYQADMVKIQGGLRRTFLPAQEFTVLPWITQVTA